MQGIKLDHAYLVMSVHEVISKGKIRRLVKVRNPSDTDIWVGSWSPRNRMRRSFPSLKSFTDREDKSQFVMPYDDYLLLFTSSVICLVQNDIRISQDAFPSEYAPQIIVDKHPQFSKMVTVDFTRKKPEKLLGPKFESAWKKGV